jgi:hypothetical protein
LGSLLLDSVSGSCQSAISSEKQVTVRFLLEDFWPLNIDFLTDPTVPTIGPEDRVPHVLAEWDPGAKTPANWRRSSLSSSIANNALVIFGHRRLRDARDDGWPLGFLGAAFFRGFATVAFLTLLEIGAFAPVLAILTFAAVEKEDVRHLSKFIQVLEIHLLQKDLVAALVQ